MNIFEKKPPDLPSTYTVSKDSKIQIIVSYVKEFWLNGKSHTDSIYSTDFDDRHNFELLLYENFRDVTKIISNTTRTAETFILENGLLHNIKSYSYKKNDDLLFSIHGKLFSEQNFYIYIREQKLKRIIDDDER